MGTNSKELAEMVRSGEYYERSRDWYQTMYIGPVSERAFFLVVAGMAGFVAILGFIALMAFLPVTDRPGIMISSQRVDETLPRLINLKTGNVRMDIAFQRFFLSNYVTRREGYSMFEYPTNYSFIRAQSDAATFNDYAARYDRSNPNSPAAILAEIGTRVVEVQSIDINDREEPKVATVNFTTQVLGVGVTESQRVKWTAVIQYYYSDLVVTPTLDSETGEEVLKTQDPQFQVVSYVLSQAK